MGLAGKEAALSCTSALYLLIFLYGRVLFEHGGAPLPALPTAASRSRRHQAREPCLWQIGKSAGGVSSRYLISGIV